MYIRCISRRRNTPFHNHRRLRTVMDPYRLPLPGYCVTEAALVLGMDEQKIYRMIRAGELPAFRHPATGRLTIAYGDLFAALKDAEWKELAESMLAG